MSACINSANTLCLQKLKRLLPKVQLFSRYGICALIFALSHGLFQRGYELLPSLFSFSEKRWLPVRFLVLEASHVPLQGLPVGDILLYQSADLCFNGSVFDYRQDLFP